MNALSKVARYVTNPKRYESRTRSGNFVSRSCRRVITDVRPSAIILVCVWYFAQVSSGTTYTVLIDLLLTAQFKNGYNVRILESKHTKFYWIRKQLQPVNGLNPETFPGWKNANSCYPQTQLCDFASLQFETSPSLLNYWLRTTTETVRQWLYQGMF